MKLIPNEASVDEIIQVWNMHFDWRHKKATTEFNEFTKNFARLLLPHLGFKKASAHNFHALRPTLIRHMAYVNLQIDLNTKSEAEGDKEYVPDSADEKEEMKVKKIAALGDANLFWKDTWKLAHHREDRVHMMILTFMFGPALLGRVLCGIHHRAGPGEEIARLSEYNNLVYHLNTSYKQNEWEDKLYYDGITLLHERITEDTSHISLKITEWKANKFWPGEPKLKPAPKAALTKKAPRTILEQDLADWCYHQAANTMIPYDQFDTMLKQLLNKAEHKHSVKFSATLSGNKITVYPTVQEVCLIQQEARKRRQRATQPTKRKDLERLHALTDSAGRRYFNMRVAPLVGEMMNRLVTKRPDDPAEHLIKWLKKRRERETVDDMNVDS